MEEEELTLFLPWPPPHTPHILNMAVAYEYFWFGVLYAITTI